MFQAGILHIIRRYYYYYYYYYYYFYYYYYYSIPILPTASQHKRVTYTNCCIYRVLPPDDEQ